MIITINEFINSPFGNVLLLLLSILSLLVGIGGIILTGKVKKSVSQTKVLVKRANTREHFSILLESLKKKAETSDDIYSLIDTVNRMINNSYFESDKELIDMLNAFQEDYKCIHPGDPISVQMLLNYSQLRTKALGKVDALVQE